MGVGTNYTFTIKRKIAASSNWGDPTWGTITTFKARRQPLSYTDSIKAGQNAQLPKELLFCDNIALDLTTKDMLVDTDGTIWYVVSIEKYRSGVRPHLEIYLSDTQWVLS